MIQRRRKIVPTYYERMIWGQGDVRDYAVDSAAGRIGQPACWEHYNPLARYAMIADGRSTLRCIRARSTASCFPSKRKSISGSMHWSLRASSSVLRPGWIPISRRNRQGHWRQHRPAIAAPDGSLLGEPVRSGEGLVIAHLDFTLIDKPKMLMDSRGHYSWLELLSSGESGHKEANIKAE